jgi:hypothetical protein
VRTILRIVMIVAVLVFLIFLWRPDFVTNAGKALMNAVHSSNTYGSALVVPNLKGQGSDLQVSLQGLTSNVHYVVTLNQGSCNGTVLKTFAAVTSDGSGGITNTFALADLQLATQSGMWVNVHEGTSASGQSVACGQVQFNGQTINTAPPTATSTSVNNNAATAVPTRDTSSSATTDPFDDTHHHTPSFPHTGIAPGNNNTYDNYTGPRKY